MIGLIFGETDFPKYIHKKIKGKKNYLIIDLTRKKYFRKDKKSHSVSVGQFGKIISILNVLIVNPCNVANTFQIETKNIKKNVAINENRIVFLIFIYPLS